MRSYNLTTSLLVALFLSSCAKAPQSDGKTLGASEKINASTLSANIRKFFIGQANWEEADFPKFSTEKKPTKTINTQWGLGEIYDIRQDVYIRSAIEAAYNQGGVTFDSITDWSHDGPFEYTKYQAKHYLNQANQVTYLDLVRLGCVSITRPVNVRNYQVLKNPSGFEFLGQAHRSEEERERYPFVGTQTLVRSKNPTRLYFIIAEDKYKISDYSPLSGQRNIEGELTDIIGMG